MNNKPSSKGIIRIINAFGYSMDGLKVAFSHEAAFRQEVVLAIIAITFTIWLDVGAVSKALMVGSVFLILIVELANSAVESVVDRISFEKHDLSKRAKDIASAMVLLAFINAIFIWAIILIDWL